MAGVISASPDDETSVLSKRRMVFLFAVTIGVVQNHVGDVSLLQFVKKKTHVLREPAAFPLMKGFSLAIISCLCRRANGSSLDS